MPQGQAFAAHARATKGFQHYFRDRNIDGQGVSCLFSVRIFWKESRMRTYVRASAPAGARCLPRNYFFSDEIYRKEEAKIFRRSWMVVGHQSQIISPGSYFQTSIAGENLFVVRNEENQIRAYRNFCTHKGHVLAEKPSGRFDHGCMVCPYHGYNFNLADGTLHSAKGLDPKLFHRYPLARVALEIWDGLILVNLDPHPKSFLGQFPMLQGKFAEWKLGELQCPPRAIIDYVLDTNWKIPYQNYSECFHCPMIHKALVKLSPPTSGVNDLTRGAILGGPMDLREGVQTLTDTGQTNRQPIPGLSSENQGRVYYYTIFPTAFLSLHPDYVMVHILRPMGVAKTHIRCMWLFHPSELNKAEFSPSDAMSFWDNVNKEDWKACENCQVGMTSEAYRPGPYVSSEGLSWAFDQHYLSQLSLLHAAAAYCRSKWNGAFGRWLTV